MNDSTLNLLISSLAGLITATLTALITSRSQIAQERIKATVSLILKESEKSGTPLSQEKLAELENASQSFWNSPSKRWIVILGAGVAAVLIFLFAFWVLSLFVHDPTTTPDALVDSFETGIAPEWTIQVGQASLSRSADYAFAGRDSLKVEVELAERANPHEKAGTVELLLKGRDLQNRIAIVRVYAPVGAPTNLFAGLFIMDAKNEWRIGSGTLLQAGQWSTLVWSTQEVLEWQTPASLGLQFALAPGSSATDLRAYKGPVYVDLVEILALPTNISSPSFDHVLRPLLFYDFESLASIPDNIIAKKNTQNIELTDEEYLPDGDNALKLNLDLTPYISTEEEGYGGIYVDLKGTQRVDAINVSVLVPTHEETQNGRFYVSFVAIDDEGGWVYSSSSSIAVGKWTPYFWGTMYAFSGHDLCKDVDKNGQCDEPADILWDAWGDPRIQGFYFRVFRYDEGYSGPVYIDNLAAYQIVQ